MYENLVKACFRIEGCFRFLAWQAALDDDQSVNHAFVQWRKAIAEACGDKANFDRLFAEVDAEDSKPDDPIGVDEPTRSRSR